MRNNSTLFRFFYERNKSLGRNGSDKEVCGGDGERERKKEETHKKEFFKQLKKREFK